MTPTHRRGEPTCTICGVRHSMLLGGPDDRGWCVDCPWEVVGASAVIWCRHHAAETGHACGVSEV